MPGDAAKALPCVRFARPGDMMAFIRSEAVQISSNILSFYAPAALINAADPVNCRLSVID